jgi:hypothetical protein
MTKQIVPPAPRWRVALGPILPALALAGLLSACGGGGAEAGPTSTPNVPVPPLAATVSEPCPSPVTADCVVQGPSRANILQMTGGRQSDYALSVHAGALDLVPQPNSHGGLPFAAVDFRFLAGTTIEDDSVLYVSYGSSLHSDVVAQSTGRLVLNGAMTGEATNHGNMALNGMVIGKVVNDGVLTPASSIWSEGSGHWVRVEGAFSQSPASTLDAVMGATFGGFVSVTGRADIDGTLRLVNYSDDWGPYPLPAVPFTVHVLHADGGVYGRFSNFFSPGLVVTGNARYLANDIFFDVTGITAAK